MRRKNGHVDVQDDLLPPGRRREAEESIIDGKEGSEERAGQALTLGVTNVERKILRIALRVVQNMECHGAKMIFGRDSDLLCSSA